MKTTAPRPVTKGCVYLVGAGPGDPELLTLRAAHILDQADAVLYDNLIHEDVLARVPSSAEKIYVGKQSNQHSLPQEAINALLISLAHEQKCVVRLKGGDPYIFGRGGEEALAIAEAGIPFEVIPGITAASGAAAYAGIPLSHRDLVDSVSFATGHLQDTDKQPDWQKLAKEKQTLVLYMAMSNLALICDKLISNGRSPEMDCAIIVQASSPRQRSIIGKLANIAELANAAEVRAPAVLIIGESVHLSKKLNWFEARKP